MLGQAAGGPALEIAADARGLHPSHPLVLEVTEHAIEVVGAGSVVDVELYEHVVVDPECLDVVEPGVDVPGLGLGLEGGTRLVPRLDPAAREVVDTVLVGERADLR
jgi:hypothetical protein